MINIQIPNKESNNAPNTLINNNKSLKNGINLKIKLNTSIFQNNNEKIVDLHRIGYINLNTLLKYSK